MSKVITEYRGKKLAEYSKEELIEIVIELGQELQNTRLEHSRQFKRLLDMLSEIT